jgi:hypothetical protein
MNPQAKKALDIAVAIITAVAALGPVVVSLRGILPPSWYVQVSGVVAMAGALHLWIAQSGVLTLFGAKTPPSPPKPPTHPLGLVCLWMLAGAMALAACTLFGQSVVAAGGDVAPILTCVEALVDAGHAPGDGTIEAAVESCGVAAADVTVTVQAIEALVATPDAGATPLAAKVAAMPHRGSK